MYHLTEIFILFFINIIILFAFLQNKENDDKSDISSNIY